MRNHMLRSSGYPPSNITNFPLGAMELGTFTGSPDSESIVDGAFRWGGTKVNGSSNLRDFNAQSNTGAVRVTVSLSASSPIDLEVRYGTSTVLGTLSAGDTRASFDTTLAGDFIRLYADGNTSSDVDVTEFFLGHI